MIILRIIGIVCVVLALICYVCSPILFLMGGFKIAFTNVDLGLQFFGLSIVSGFLGWLNSLVAALLLGLSE